MLLGPFLGLEGINEVPIPLVVDPDTVWLLLDTIAHVYNILNIMYSVHGHTSYVGDELKYIQSMSHNYYCLSSESDFHDIPGNMCVLITDRIIFVSYLI